MTRRLGSNDGAFQGYTADEALGVVVGGKDEPEQAKTKAEMRTYIETAPDQPQDYGDTARAAAKLVLGFLERHPEAQNLPADNEGAFGLNDHGERDWKSYHVTREGLSDYIKRIEPALGAHPIFGELTGFMWGWAVNAARNVLDLPPVSNPAIVTVTVGGLP